MGNEARLLKSTKVSRPELDEDSQWLLNTFMKQNLFHSQKEVMRAALEALFEKQMIEEAKEWDKNSNTSDEVIYSQVEVKIS